MAVFCTCFVRDTSLFGCELCVVGEEFKPFGEADLIVRDAFVSSELTKCHILFTAYRVRD